MKIVAASSLSHSIKNPTLDSIRDSLNDIVYSEPGLNLNPNSTNASKNVTNLLLKEFKEEHIILWHDLFNNSISKHSTNNDTPLSPNQLIKTLKTIPNLYCIVHCQRNGTPNIQKLNCFVVDITKHILSKLKQLNDTIIERYRVLHQSIDQELRTLSVILHYYPRIERIFKTRGSKRTSTADRQGYQKRPT